ncbi:hypothetical protein QRX50_40735 [Amycolatopsis carbonis]|uniref:J domain-containing protein n=1 Tax=Amycolatopsis carbonis TaxID=715471 RepID=A0A9Y2ID08_9PSEU|nr:hypothetical protein [Amycolatopsis sp. 2-15]WIX77669.1 hypothetical protein QRX50_40735 [Amycolatopsis sp. 2-15]
MPDKPRSTWSAAEKAAYREFVRTHHPDAGGDAEAFREGLARFHQVDKPARQPASRQAESVSFVVRRRGLTRVLAAHRRRRRTRVR